MRYYIHPAGADPAFHWVQRPGGALYRLLLLHAEDEHYSHAQPVPGPGAPRGHAHDVYHVCLYTQGQSHFVLNGRLCPCRPGTLVVTTPGDWHDFRPHGAGTTTAMELTFTAAPESGEATPWAFHELLGACVRAPLDPAEWPAPLDAPQARQAEILMDALLDRLTRRDTLLGCDIERMMLDLFRFLAHEVYGAGGVGTDLTEDRLAQARAAIEARFRERLRLPDLARDAGMSSGYFSRAFRRRYTIPPMAYQLTLRIRSAKTLLDSGNMSIGEIAARVGFPDIYTFSRMFKRIEGVSPRAYRDGHRQERTSAAPPGTSAGNGRTSGENPVEIPP